MKVRTKIFLITLLSILSFGVIIVAQASAAAYEYIIEGSEVTSSTKSEGTSGLTLIAGTISGVAVKVECTEDTLTGEIEPVGAGNNTMLLKNCTAAKPAGCSTSLTSELKVKTELLASEETPIAELTGSGSGEELTKITLEGGGCVVAGTYTLSGKQACGLPNAEKELTEHETACKKNESKLTLGGNAATLSSTEKVKLSSAKKWALRPIFRGPSWFVEGNRLGMGEKGKPITFTGGPIAIKAIAGFKGHIECGTVGGTGELIGSAARAVGTYSTKLELKECKDLEEKGCEIISYTNKETVMQLGGQIGPISVTSELVFPGNTNNRTFAGDLFLPEEENTKARFGEISKVFVVIEFKKIAAEVCAENGKRFSVTGAPAGGPVAEMWIAGKDAASREQAEQVEFKFPKTPYTKVEKWTAAGYKREGVELQWFNELKELTTLEIEGKLVGKFTGKNYGWLAG